MAKDFHSFDVRERTDEPLCVAAIKFLETTYGFWGLMRARQKAIDEERYDDVLEIDQKQKPVVEEADRYLKEVVAIRAQWFHAFENNREFREQENERCKHDIVHWVNYYTWTYDPRLPPFELPGNIPMVMWPKQEEFILFMDECYHYGLNWAAPKSRGYGLSYLACLFFVHHFLYVPGFAAGFGSRTEDYVDGGNPKSLFWKIRHILYGLPEQMRPPGLEKPNGRYDNYMSITNPETNSTIGGEGGKNIGAGDRKSVYVCDEKALHLTGENIDTALSQTTNCQGDISTIRGMNHFMQKVKSGKVRVFWAWWHHDPAKNPRWRDDKKPGPGENEWREYQDERHDPVINAQEVDIDPQASVEDSFIPSEWVRACIGFDVPAEGKTQGGFDVAAGGANKSVYVSRTGPVVRLPHEIAYDTPNEAAVEAVKLAETDGVSEFVYDQDGLGEGILGTFKVADYPIQFDMIGVHGNSPASDEYLSADGMTAREKFRNKRSENWWSVRERARKTFEHRKGIRLYEYDQMLSLPNDEELAIQLSQPKRLWRGTGLKVAVESKREMRGRGVESPDKADAVVNALADTSQMARVASALDYKAGGNVREFEIDPESAIGDQYVTMYQTPDMTVHALCCWWNSNAARPMLRVYWEFVEQNPDVAKFVREIKEVMNNEIKPIRKWICNDEMQKPVEQGRIAPWYVFRRQGRISLRLNYMDDFRGSVMVLNTMLDKHILEIHPGCEKLYMQLANWRMKSGKPDLNMGLSLALCNFVTWLRTIKSIKPVMLTPSWKPRRPYNNAIGHFARTAKPAGGGKPSYFKKAEYAYGNTI